MKKILEDQNYWIIDSNKWSKNITTKEEAEKYSATLTNCSDCTNCIDCSYCTNCNDCSGCTSCGDCNNCRDCRYCRYCSDCTSCNGCIYCIDCNGCTSCTSCTSCVSCTSCTSCRDCNNCGYCDDCSYCIDCSYCSDCTSCNGCISCRGFKMNPERIRSPKLGSRNSQTTYYWTEEKEQIVCGCFQGSLQEFENEVKKTHDDNDFAKGYFKWIEAVKKYKETYGGNK